jgi:hypothetical protein
MKSHIAMGRRVALALMLGATAAHAQLVISKKPTMNVSCSAGQCSATEAQAVLNVKDLKTLIQRGDLQIFGSTKGLEVKAALSWTKHHKLTLNATPIYIASPVRVEGRGALTITTLDLLGGPALSFSEKGSVTFLDMRSNLTINNLTFKLEPNLQSLIADIAADGDEGFYALNSDDDASAYGTFSQSPVGGVFDGEVDGLGHTISNLRIATNSDQDYVGLFHEVGLGHSIRNLNLTSVDISAAGGSCVGVLVGDNLGNIGNGFISGNVSASQALATGGAIGCNYGDIFDVFADDAVTGNVAGGLVGDQQGSVIASAAGGSVTAQAGPNHPAAGGLIGESNQGPVQGSYSFGEVSGTGDLGGAIGDAFQGSYTDLYWDTTTSGTTQGCQETCTGVTGLTTTQLRSGLPAGFDPGTWGQNQKIENGLPYLLAAVPR